MTSKSHQGEFGTHSMHLGPKISGVELAFMLAWRRGYSLNYTLLAYWSNKMEISTHGSFDLNPQSWRTLGELLAHLRREFNTGYTLQISVQISLNYDMYCTTLTLAKDLDFGCFRIVSNCFALFSTLLSFVSVLHFFSCVLIDLNYVAGS